MARRTPFTDVTRFDWAIGCGMPILLTILLYQVTAARIRPTAPEPFRSVFAVGSAICFAAALTGIVGFALGYGRGERSRAGARRRARGEQPPVDGRPLLATGQVRALTAPLTAPLSGIPCAAYQYRMYFIDRSLVTSGIPNAGARSSMVTVYWGFASVPFALDSPTRRVSVYAVPRLEIPVSTGEGGPAIARARDFITRTSFEPSRAGPLGALSSVFDQFQETMTDADGAARRDWMRDGPPVDPSNLLLEEVALPIDAEASVNGPWSSARGGIVAPGALLAETHVVAVLGRPDQQMQKLEVEHSTTASLVAIFFFAALGAALLWFAKSISP